MQDSAYTIRPARYAKGMVAIHTPSDANGNRTRAGRVMGALPGRYSGREKAYIVSPRAATRFEAHYLAGGDASLGNRRGILDWVLDKLP